LIWIHRSTATSTFNDILATFDLKQDVSFSSHIHDHWLDLLIARSTTDYIHTLIATDCLSDYFTVVAKIKFKPNPVDSKCNIFYRYTHDIDILVFNDDIVKFELITNPKADLSQLCKQYHTILKTLLDKHSHVRSKSTKIKTPAPCMSPEIINAKLRRRYLDRIWRKSRTQLNSS